MSLLLGIARENITPKIGACLYGYRPDIRSTSVEDELNATAFYFRKGDTEALWISATVCLINTELVTDIRTRIAEQSGIPFENIIISATHTHSGPNTCGSYGWGDIDREYCDGIFIPALLSVAKKAKETPVEVEMGVGIGESDIGINRREVRRDGSIALGQNPWGCYNPQMTVIAFRDTSHKPVANILHYGMHGTCAGMNYEISRDWSGITCDMLEKDSGAVTAFFTGPEGDVGPRLSNGLTVGGGDIAYVHEIGNKAALDAVKIYKTVKIYDPDPKLQIMQTNMSLPLQKRYGEETCREMVKKYEGATVNLSGGMRRYFETVLQSYADGYEDRPTRSVPHNFLVLGNVAIVSFPYEMFSEIGLRIAKFSPFPYTLSLACTNGSESYFAAETDICRGGYEIDSFRYSGLQPFVDNADTYLVNDTLEDLEKLYRG